MKVLTIAVGFITNSSSVIHWYPREILEDPTISAYLNAYNMKSGFVGDDLWNREACSSVLVNEEQRIAAAKQLAASEYSPIDCIKPDDTSVILIYGDEYNNATSILAHLIDKVCDKLEAEGKPSFRGSATDYN